MTLVQKKSMNFTLIAEINGICLAVQNPPCDNNITGSLFSFTGEIHRAFRDFLVFTNCTKVAVLYRSEGDAGRESLLLQDALLQDGIDCMARKIDPFQVSA